MVEHVARTWPPRKRHFPRAGGGLHGQTVLTDFRPGGAHAASLFDFRPHRGKTGWLTSLRSDGRMRCSRAICSLARRRRVL